MIHQSSSPCNDHIALKALSPNIRSPSFQDQALPSCDLRLVCIIISVPKKFQEFDTQAQYLHKSAQLNQATEIYTEIIF